MKNVFIHFGAHKTGTTFLQSMLRNNPEFFTSRNSVAITKRESKEAMEDLISWQWGKNGRPDKLPKKFDLFLKGLSKDGRDSVLLSYEGLLGRMDLGRTKDLYPGHQQISRLIKDALPGINIKVAFCIRNHADFIESSYKWLVKDGISRNFEAYKKDINTNNLSWVPIVNSLIDAYGRENFLLWSYEHYRKDSIAFNLEMLRFFYGDVSETEIYYKKFDGVNVSYNAMALEMIRELNKILKSEDGLSKAQKDSFHRKYKKAIGRVFNKTNDPHVPSLLTEQEKIALSKIYKEDIEKIKSIYGDNLFLTAE